MSDGKTEIDIGGVGIINIQGFTCTPVDGSKPKINGKGTYRINPGPETGECKLMVSKDDYTTYIAPVAGTTKRISANNAAWQARTGKTTYFNCQTCYIKKEGENKNEVADEATDENVEVTLIPIGEFTNLDVVYARGVQGEAVTA